MTFSSSSTRLPGSIGTIFPYVFINKIAELTGYTEKAARRKIEDGVWIEGIHYRRSPDGRIHLNLETYKQWLEGVPATASRS